MSDMAMQKALWPALGIGLIGCALCAVGLAMVPRLVAAAWLDGVMFWIAFPVGALALLLIAAMVDAEWSDTVWRILRAMSRALPVCAAAMIPLAAALPVLYPWAQPASDVRSAYLNAPLVILRAVFYLALWGAILFGLRHAQGRRDVTSRFAAIGLVLLFFSITLAAIDWIMSLEAPWRSSIYGLLITAEWILAAAAGAVAVLCFAAPREMEIGTERLASLGNLLLALALLLAYLSFMQYLIVWEENLPKEIDWYVRRTLTNWGFLAIAMIVLQFGAPFLLLLPRALKRRRGALGAIAVVLVIAHLVHIWWLVLPAFGKAGAHWLVLAALLGIGGFVSAAFIAGLARQPRPGLEHGVA